MAIPEGDEYSQYPQSRERYGLRLRSTFTNLLRGVIDTVLYTYGFSTGWLHFYPGQKRNEWFTFATHARMSRGAPSPRSRALIHISPSCGPTQWVAPRARIAQPRSGRAIRVVERAPRLALSTWRRHRMLSE